MPNMFLDGVCLVLSEQDMERLTTVLADRLMQKFEENWSTYLQTQLAELTGKLALVEKDVARLDSDLSDMDSRIEESDSKIDDFISSDDLDVDAVNEAIGKLENFDVEELEEKVAHATSIAERLDTDMDRVNTIFTNVANSILFNSVNVKKSEEV